MDLDFWKTRWEAGQTGFHLDRVNPHLERSWDVVAAGRLGKVFVPLSGKSLDMAWLAARGHEVVGVEVSEVAVSSFFSEQGVEPVVTGTAGIPRYSANSVSILCGDFFSLEAEHVADCSLVYDRAALIALPAPLRRRYADKLSRLLPNASQLLVTFNYNQSLMDGPPFAVSDEEVRDLYGSDFEIEALESSVDILESEPRFAAKGLDWLTESSFRLTPR